MSELSELDAKQSVETSTAVTDRRRPGRVHDVSPELIPILRGQEPEIAFEPDDVDQTAALRGVCVGVVLSAPIWAAIAYVGHLILSK